MLRPKSETVLIVKEVSSATALHQCSGIEMRIFLCFRFKVQEKSCGYSIMSRHGEQNSQSMRS